MARFQLLKLSLSNSKCVVPMIGSTTSCAILLLALMQSGEMQPCSTLCACGCDYVVALLHKLCVDTSRSDVGYTTTTAVVTNLSDIVLRCPPRAQHKLERRNRESPIPPRSNGTDSASTINRGRWLSRRHGATMRPQG